MNIPGVSNAINNAIKEADKIKKSLTENIKKGYEGLDQKLGGYLPGGKTPQQVQAENKAKEQAKTEVAIKTANNIKTTDSSSNSSKTNSNNSSSRSQSNIKNVNQSNNNAVGSGKSEKSYIEKVASKENIVGAAEDVSNVAGMILSKTGEIIDLPAKIIKEEGMRV